MTADPYQKKTCRYCDAPLEKSFLDLGNLPLANSYVRPEDALKEEFRCPLKLTRCKHCHLIQLSHVVPPEMMFSHYLYVSSTTKTFQDHFASYAQSVRKHTGKKEKALAVDIGSNDGLLLSCYEREGFTAVGIDPAKNLADAANAKGLKTLNRFFDEACVKEIISQYGKAAVISGNNVFAHIDDIASVLRNVSALLDQDGIFVIEFPYLVTMLEEMLFDMIYHEHLSYIGVTSLSYVLARFGFEIFDIEQVSSHGGSLRVYIQKKGTSRKIAAVVGELLRREKSGGYLEETVYERFADRVRTIKKDFTEVMKMLRAQKKKVAGYGAPAKASTILGFYGLSAAEIAFVVDDNPLKQNYLIPGTKIPIVPSKKLDESKVDVVIIFAWNFAKEILKKIGYLKARDVTFLLPLPARETERSKAGKIETFEITAA